MKVQGLDGREYNWNLRGLRPLGDDTRPRSKYHVLARKILSELFPLDVILEEAFLPGCGKLYIDFFLPAYKLVVEANGPQHYKFCRHFHVDKRGFIKSLERDVKKAEWCGLNEMALVILKFDEDENDWRRHILDGKAGRPQSSFG